MLTPTDIHYIVGLLSKASHAENVEIELGEYVYDQAAESKRDVDVTIKVRNNDGSISVFKGIEVKAHSRKLGSEPVEQLIQKLADMPDVTHSAIVSASGYTKPAMRKAKKHGVDLYELRTWMPTEGFDFFKCEPCPAVRTECGWAQPPHVRINPSQKHTQEEQELLLSNPLVFFEDGQSKALQTWLHDVSRLAAKKAEAHSGPSLKRGVRALNATVTFKFTDTPHVLRKASKVLISEVSFIGIVELRTTEMPSIHKALFKIGDPTPIAGCCISDFGDFGLIGLLISGRRVVELVRIPVSDRNKKKIFRQKLSTHKAPTAANLKL